MPESSSARDDVERQPESDDDVSCCGDDESLNNSEVGDGAEDDLFDFVNELRNVYSNEHFSFKSKN